MRHTVFRAFFLWDFEKEQKWLNEMAAKGMNLVGVGGFKYTFEEGTPGEYQYNLEWLQHYPNHPESVAYIRFLEDAGVEHVGSFRKWAYVRKKASAGAFELVSDLDSRIDHFRRIAVFTSIVLALMWVYLGLVLGRVCMQGHFERPLLAISLAYLPLTTFLGYGLYKSVVAYRSLKKQRTIHE